MNNLVTQPFYEIFKGDTPITEKVERFEYETTSEKDNALTLTIATDFRYNPLQKDLFREGDELKFCFGLLGERAKRSPFHVCRIVKIGRKYEDKVTITIKAFDKGNAMKKTKGLKSYSEKPVKEIIQEIAERNGLSAKIEKGAGEFTAGAIVQGGRNDLAFCQYLCALEPNGDYIVFVQDNEMRYEKVGYDKKAKKTYYLFGDEKNVVSFSSDYEEAQKSSAMQNTTTIIPAEKEVQAKSIIPQDDKTTALGKNKVTTSYIFDKNANEIGTNVISPSEPIKQQETQNPQAKTPQVSTAATQREKAGQKILKGELTIELEPNIFPNEVITIAGGFEIDNGNWLVLTCKHSGSTTRITLTKNGTNRKGKGGITAGQDKGVIKAEKSNTTIGETKQEGKIILYNRNAEKV